jgi:transcriptional regulator with GAF, ATPase, and Fis domain
MGSGQISLNQPLDNEVFAQALPHEHSDEQGGEWLEIAALAAGTTRLAAMIGRCEPMRDLFRTVGRLGPHKSTVLIQGESGTGKELVARALHLLGAAPKGPFITFNCSNLVDTLAESQLFGHMRGAFTDARETSLGYFRSADGGTLFLDEIGELPLRLQAKLLRVVETREVQPVGSAQSHLVDIRLTAATNCDLRAMVKAGQFRDDLYYRLNTSLVVIPPLRERVSDIEGLVAHYVEHYNTLLGKQVKYITRRALKALLRYDWPGNVRELSHVVESAMLLTDSDRVDLGNMPAYLVKGTAGTGGTTDLRAVSTGRLGAAQTTTLSEDAAPLSLDQAVNEAAKDALVRALHRSEGNCIRAARLLGVSRYTVYRMISRFGLTEVRPNRGVR